MIKYKCENCNDLISETSICPVCDKRASLFKSEIYYCPVCNAPSFDKNCSECHSECFYIGSDIRPVFARERLLLEVLLACPMKYKNDAVWNTSGSNYYVNGKKIKVSFVELRKNDINEVISKLNQYEEENMSYVDNDFESIHIKKFIKINQVRLNEITEEAVSYIKEVSAGFDFTSMFVSFSGGKDSTVISHLVIRALNNQQIMHIYGDTTLEYPESEKYIAEFKKEFPKTPLLVAKNNEQSFQNLCEVVGPPSRVMRWCCTIFKTGAITKKIEQTFKNAKSLLSFQGIRRSESISRSKYDRDTENSKISKQKVASPIIDWLDMDVWLYILSNRLPFNNAYRQGFNRVGCWCCPNNSGWSEFLSGIYMNEQYITFRNILYSFAQKIGKEDWKDYIDDGNWKARQGGNGLDYSKNVIVSFKPCALDNSSYNFDLRKPIDNTLFTFFIPFGKLDFEMGNKRLNEVYVLQVSNNEPILKIAGKIGDTKLKITILKKQGIFKSPKTAEEAFKNQITKFQTCIGCTYCQSVCKHNALKVVNTAPGSVSNNSISYVIDSDKCLRCLECVKHFDGGCYMKKVLRTKKENANEY